jgi:hypothetical protein
VGHENSYQIAIKNLFCPKCRIASYNTQEAILGSRIHVKQGNCYQILILPKL